LRSQRVVRELETLPKQATQGQQLNEFKREHEEMRLKHLIALHVQADAEDRVQKIREEAERKEKV
jgi:hypothetical protein